MITCPVSYGASSHTLFSVVAADAIGNIVCDGSSEDPCLFLKGFTAGFGPIQNAWNVAKPQIFVRETLAANGTAYEVTAGLNPGVQVGTYWNKNDAFMAADQFNLMCNEAFDSGRVINLEEYQSDCKQYVIVDGCLAEKFYNVMQPRLHHGVPVCIHTNFSACEAFAVRNVVGDGRCMFRALSWLQFGTEDMHQYLSNAIVDEVMQHWSRYQDLFITVHGENLASPKAYEAYMRNTRSFGTLVEALGFVHVFNRHVTIWEPTDYAMQNSGPSRPRWRARLHTSQLVSCNGVQAGPPLHLLLRQNHYLALLPIAYKDGVLATDIEAAAAHEADVANICNTTAMETDSREASQALVLHKHHHMVPRNATLVRDPEPGSIPANLAKAFAKQRQMQQRCVPADADAMVIDEQDGSICTRPEMGTGPSQANHAVALIRQHHTQTTAVSQLDTTTLQPGSIPANLASIFQKPHQMRQAAQNSSPVADAISQQAGASDEPSRDSGKKRAADTHDDSGRIQCKLTQQKPKRKQAMLLLADGSEVVKTPHLSAYLKTRDYGSIYPCVCCTLLHFLNRVSVVTTTWKISIATCQEWLHETRDVNDMHYVCKTCKDGLNKGKLPRMAKSQGFEMAPSEERLTRLTPVEGKMVATQTPFMNLRRIRPSCNPMLRGPVTLVPNDLLKVVNALPRTLHDTQVIMVNFKRKLKFNRAAWSETVRPNMILEALNYLCKNGKLYLPWASRLLSLEEVKALTQRLLCSVNDDGSGLLVLGADSVEEAQPEMIVSDASDDEDHTDLTQLLLDLDTAAEAHGVPLPNHEFRRLAAANGSFNPQSLLAQTTVSMVNRMPPSACADMVVNVAPAENQKPVSLFATADAEECCFPVEFAGNRRKAPEGYAYHEICKWELLNADRRFAYNAENLMFKVRKMQTKALAGAARLQLRKKQSGYPRVTKQNAMNKEFLKNMIRNDNAFCDLKVLRSSPQYMARAKRDVFAMLAQLGPPSWFFTLSMADYHWHGLLAGLYYLAHGKLLHPDEVKGLSYTEKTDLISKDPIFCARYFKETALSFIRNVLGKELDIIGGLRDFFVRDETQGRGTMHDHGVGWPIEHTPRYRTDPDSVIIEYIDSHITCDPAATTPQLLALQLHSRHKTCGKKGRFPCKHGYPKFPMPDTMILTPLPQAEVTAEIKADTKRVKEVLLDMANKMQTKAASMEDLDMTHAAFLELCQLNSHAEYLLVVRNLLAYDEVVLQRKPNAILINNFNPKALALWQANMDLQFILDPYAAVNYVVHYMTKVDPVVSKAIEATMRVLETHPASKDEMYFRVGTAFLNAYEISGQEAAYLALGMPFRFSSRATQYIPSADQYDRTTILKTLPQMAPLALSSLDTQLNGIHEHYAERPPSLDNISLADFACWYTADVVVSERADPLLHDTMPTVDQGDVEVDGQNVVPDKWLRPVYTATWPKKAGKYRLRTKAKVLMVHMYSCELQARDFYRQQLTLYLPWRDEKADIEAHAAGYKARCNAHAAAICEVSKRYRPNGIDWAGLEVEVRQSAAADSDSDSEDGVMRLGQQPLAEGTTEVDMGDDALHVMRQELRAADQEDTTNILERRSFSLGKCEANLVSDDLLAAIVNGLNHEQRAIFEHMRKQARQNRHGELIFMSGGAGTGKSFATRAIFQMITRMYRQKPGFCFNKQSVAVMAPTGTAAFNVRGNTIHSALGIPANKNLSGPFLSLHAEKLATFQSEWCQVQLVIIDEISMVGSRMLHYIDERLRQIKAIDMPFGGVNVLAVGDLYQLKPVMDSWVFEVPAIAFANVQQSPWDAFKLHELTIVMRQDNLPFIERLNRLRIGAHTVGDLQWFLSRCLDNMSAEERAGFDTDTPHMFYKNQAVQAHNKEFLDSMTGTLQVLTATDSLVQHTADKGIEHEMLELAKATDSRQAGALPYIVELKVDAPVELAVNVDVPDGLTNGARGTLKAFEWALAPTRSIACLWASFDEERVGMEARANATAQYRRQPCIHPSWTPVRRWGVRFGVGPRKAVEINRIQFPLVPCAARTIHRFQGGSLKRAVIGLDKLHAGSCAGIHYTAVSRLTNPEGLAFTNFNPNGIRTSQEVTVHYAHKGATALLQPDLGRTMFNNRLHFSVMTLNARSLHKNIENLRRTLACNIYNPTFMIVTESWQALQDSKEMYAIPGYNMVDMPSSAATHGSPRPSRGIIMYSCSRSPKVLHVTNHGTATVDCTLTVHRSAVGRLSVIGVYSPPHQPSTTLLKCLDNALQDGGDAPTIIAGDFNINMMEGSIPELLCSKAADLVAFMLSRGFAMRQPFASHAGGSLLDHVWTNLHHKWPLARQKPFVKEAWFSDHLAVGLNIDIDRQHDHILGIPSTAS